MGASPEACALAQRGVQGRDTSVVTRRIKTPPPAQSSGRRHVPAGGRGSSFRAVRSGAPGPAIPVSPEKVGAADLGTWVPLPPPAPDPARKGEPAGSVAARRSRPRNSAAAPREKVRGEHRSQSNFQMVRQSVAEPRWVPGCPRPWATPPNPRSTRSVQESEGGPDTGRGLTCQATGGHAPCGQTTPLVRTRR